MRWSDNTGVEFKELKAYYLNGLKEVSNGMSYDDIIERLKPKKREEAGVFNINPDNTICNFMLEILVEERVKQSRNSIQEHIANALNIPIEEREAFFKSVDEKENELGLAPDISDLDREENQLFQLACDAAEMFDGLMKEFGEEPRQLSEGGLIEARIFCSTLVMDLHSEFKNQIDLENPADRYFLLLHDQSLASEIDDTISFLNSRIAFYKNEYKQIKSMNALQRLSCDTALARVFNSIYLNPLCSNPEQPNTSEITINDMVVFGSKLDKIVSLIQQRKNKILGCTDSKSDEFRRDLMAVLNGIVPENKRAIMDKNMAWVFADCTLEMIKTGELDKQITSLLPLPTKGLLNTLIKTSVTFSESELEAIFEDVKEEYISNFKN